MFLSLAALALQPLPPVPAPPAPPSPLTVNGAPVIRPSPATFPRFAPLEVKVRLTASGRPLVEEQLRLSPGANIRRNRSQGLPANCPNRTGSRSEGLTVSFNPFWGALGEVDAGQMRARVSVEWERPIADPCSLGSRTVEMEDYPVLLPGRSYVFEGDAGLRLELTVLGN